MKNTLHFSNSFYWTGWFLSTNKIRMSNIQLNLGKIATNYPSKLQTKTLSSICLKIIFTVLLKFSFLIFPIAVCF